MQNNGTIFIEALGYRGNATGGILIGVGSEAPLWTSGACSVVNSRALGLNHSDVVTQHMDFRTNAFPVRCDLECFFSLTNKIFFSNLKTNIF